MPKSQFKINKFSSRMPTEWGESVIKTRFGAREFSENAFALMSGCQKLICKFLNKFKEHLLLINCSSEKNLPNNWMCELWRYLHKANFAPKHKSLGCGASCLPCVCVCVGMYDCNQERFQF